MSQTNSILFATLMIASIGSSGCMSIANTDTNTDQTFGDPINKIGGQITPEQAADLQGRTITGPEISLFGGNLSLGFFRYAKGVTEQFNGSQFNHGSAAFSSSAANGVQSKTEGRRGRTRTFGAERVESEAQTKDLFDGLNGLAEKYLASTPAGQILLSKKAEGQKISNADIDSVLADDKMPAEVRTQVGALKSE